LSATLGAEIIIKYNACGKGKLGVQTLVCSTRTRSIL